MNSFQLLPKVIGSSFKSHLTHLEKKTAYLRQISNIEDALTDLKSKEPQLFAHIWGNMSKESRAQVEKIQ